MIKSKNIFISLLVILLIAVPITVLAASQSNEAGVTLTYPGGDVTCDNLITTSGVPADGYVVYRFFYVMNGSQVFLTGNINNGGGNLAVYYPVDQAPADAEEYGIFIAAFDGAGTQLGSPIGAKWNCGEPEPTNTQVPPTPTKTEIPPTPTNTEVPPTPTKTDVPPTPTYTPVPPTNTPASFAGCTPGYWKNHLNKWPATGYSTGSIFNTVFGVNYFGDDYTLNDGIRQGGGQLRRAARHGTAALLNATHPDVSYPYSAAQVIALVQAGDETSINFLEAANELGCSIGN
jgi:hypothetical protein